MYYQYKEAVERGEDIGVVVRLAREAGTSAALTARTVLEEWLSAQREEGEGRVDDKVVKQQVNSVQILWPKSLVNLRCMFLEILSLRWGGS